MSLFSHKFIMNNGGSQVTLQDLLTKRVKLEQANTESEKHKVDTNSKPSPKSTCKETAQAGAKRKRQKQQDTLRRSGATVGLALEAPKK